MQEIVPIEEQQEKTKLLKEIEKMLYSLAEPIRQNDERRDFLNLIRETEKLVTIMEECD